VHPFHSLQANKKVEHIFDTFCANLPPGSQTLVVQNCSTITFYAQYPLRRIQIVLKLVESPKTVLLNFDLDYVQWMLPLWMLPHGARACFRAELAQCEVYEELVTAVPRLREETQTG
jgi:hypothetical protein